MAFPELKAGTWGGRVSMPSLVTWESGHYQGACIDVLLRHLNADLGRNLWLSVMQVDIPMLWTIVRSNCYGNGGEKSRPWPIW